LEISLGRKPPDASQPVQLQALKPFEIAIETHQAPAIGDRQGRQMGIGAEPGRQLSVTQQLVKHLPAVVLRRGQLHARLLAQGFEQGGGFCNLLDGCAHQLRLAHQADQPQSGHRAEQHLFCGLLFPVMNGVLVMAVGGPGQRQLDIQIRQVGGGAQGSSSSNRAALLSWCSSRASGPSKRGSVAADRVSPARSGAALSPCST
jgi:hypothetical protein